MPVVKRVLCPDRVRRVPAQFSWVDHRLVQDRRLCGCSPPALALYLFLVTVADAQGLSYWADASICSLLSLEGPVLCGARQELMAADLIAWHKPLYQVLALDDEPPQPRAPRTESQPLAVGQILSAMMRRTS